MPNILDQHARPSTPFTHSGGPIGVLLVHGFLGSPHELQPLAERLAKDGHTVRVILLPGHGQNPEHLKGIGWQRWADHVQTELEVLKRSTQKTVMIGFSMGGLLSLLKAAKNQCDALVTMAPALELRLQKQMQLAGLMKYVMPWMYPFKDADFGTRETRTNIRQYIPDADFYASAPWASVGWPCPACSVRSPVKAPLAKRRSSWSSCPADRRIRTCGI